MPNPACFAELQLVRLRAAKIGSGGAPATGANNGYVTDAVVKMDVAIELNKGSDLEVKNGAGAICAAFKDCDRIKRLNLTMELCQLDWELMSLLVGSDIASQGGNTIGGQFPSVSGACPTGACIEVWTRAWDGGAAAVPALTSPNAAYWQWVFPHTNWQLDKWNMEDNFTTFTMTGEASENPKITANGPYDDWPAGVAAMGGITRVGGSFLTSAVPAAQCGRITVTSAAS